MTPMTPAIEQYPQFEKGSPSTQYQQISNFCVNYLEGLLVNLMHMDLPESLEKKTSSYVTLQQLLLKRERTVRHSYQFQIEKNFSDFKLIRRTRLHANRSGGWMSVGLTGQNSSTVQNRIESISGHYQKQCDVQLQNLSKRLKTLVHRSDESQDDNPLSPANLCNAFLASIEALSLTALKTCQLVELFDQVLNIHLENFYNQIDLGLYYLDILPELTDPVLFLRPDITEVDLEVGLPAAIAEQDFIETVTIHVAEKIQEKEQIPAVEAPIKTVEELPLKQEQSKKLKLEQIKDLLLVFKEDTQQGTYDYIILFEELEENFRALISKKQQNDVHKFSRYFTHLLDNSILSNQLRIQLSRLSHPMIKLVLIDPFFFRSSSHPVNDFLQSVIDFEIRYKHDEKNLDALSQLIAQIAGLDDPDLSDFYPVIGMYESFKQEEVDLFKQAKEQEVLEELKLKQNILELVNDTTSKLVVDQTTLSFFYDDWQLMLLQLAIKVGLESKEYKQSVEIIKMLAWSLEEKKEEHPEFSKYSFTSILKAIDKGLAALNYPSAHRSRTRKLLVKEFKKNNSESSISIVSSKQKRPTTKLTHISSLIGQKTFQLSDLNKRPSRNVSTSDYKSAGKNLEMGSWFEIKTDKSRKLKRAKLKWKSQDNNQFLFVDQRGHKIRETNLEQLDHDLSKGMIKLLSKPSITGRPSALGHGFDCYSNN